MKDPRPLRWLLLGLAFAFLTLFVGLPIVAVFVEAFRKGAAAYFDAIRDPETLAAIKLTVLTAAVKQRVNERMQADVIQDVLVEDFNYVSKEEFQQKP